MSREFGQIWQDIFDSSLADNRHHRWIFADLVILAGSTPYIRMSPRLIAHRIKVPLEEVMEAINALKRPDEHSKTSANQGRRIEQIDPSNENAGFFILNWDKWKADKAQETAQARKHYKKVSERGRREKARDSHVNVITDNVVILENKKAAPR